MYARLRAACGPQHWWPAETPTEVVVGAILTQNTAWVNVERAISNLRQAACLSWSALRDLTEEELARLIRPSGTYRVKAARLKAFVGILWRVYGGSLEAMLAGPLDRARDRLLRIPGIGPETADAILLYAGGRSSFVVDAYTRRVLRRHHVIDDRANYDGIRRRFHAAIRPNSRVYNEYHALFVVVGKKHCRSMARCEGCPLEDLPHDGSL
jgi:endonuclease-3 related protein